MYWALYFVLISGRKIPHSLSLSFSLGDSFNQFPMYVIRTFEAACNFCVGNLGLSSMGDHSQRESVKDFSAFIKERAEEGLHVTAQQRIKQ